MTAPAPPAAPRPRRRLRRALIIALLVLLALAAAAPFVLPLLVEAALGRAVDRLAGRHGLDVTWAASDLRADGLTLTDVAVRAEIGRAKVPRLEVEVSLWRALTGEVRVTAVRLSAPELWVGADADDGRDAIESSDGMSALERMASEPFEMPSTMTRLMARLGELETLPTVYIERPRAIVQRGGRTHSAQAASARLDPADDGWALTAEGVALDVGGRRLDGLRADGAIGSGRVALGLDFVGASLAVGGGEVAAEAAKLLIAPGLAEIRVTGVLAALAGGRIEGATLTARWTDGLALAVSGGTVTVSRGLLRRLTGRVGSEMPSMPSEPSDAPEPSEPSESSHAIDPWRLPAGVRVEAEGMTVDLPGLPPMLEAALGWTDGHLDARAVLAGGEIALAADFEPGHLRPDGLHAEIRGVRLAPLFARRLPPEPPRRPRVQSRADGILDGTLTLATPADGPLGRGLTLVDGAVSWREGRVELEGLADGPVDGIDLHAEARFAWDPGADVLHFAGRVAQGPLAMLGEGSVLDARGDPRVKLEARGEPIDCADAFAAVPVGLWGPYDRARLSGTLKPRIRFDWPVHRPQTLELKIRGLFKACEIETLRAREWPPATVEGKAAPGLDDVGWLDARFVLPVTEGVSEGAEVIVGPGAPGYVPLGELPRYVGATMYQSEEMNFWRNNAIDRGLLMRALRIDLEHGRFVYGGSTVTQQLVKNLFLTRRKTLARKLQELLVATRITQAIGRHRVLELYLNCIEFGPDVYGIGPASRYYFQKDARQLSPREAVFLAMLKPAPGRGAAYRRRGHGPTHGWWVERAEELMRRLVEYGQISPETAAAERPYHMRWVERRYVPNDRFDPIPDGGPTPAPTAPDAAPDGPPEGGRRLPITPVEP